MEKNKTNFMVVGGRDRDQYAEMPDLADLYAMAYKTINDLPEKFHEHTANLLVRVENFADPDILDQLNLQDKYDLLGLYRGTPLPQKNMHSSSAIPDVIFLYRCPIIRFARESDEKIDVLVHHVMIHEMGHHFGYNDYDMEWIVKNS